MFRFLGQSSSTTTVQQPSGGDQNQQQLIDGVISEVSHVFQGQGNQLGGNQLEYICRKLGQRIQQHLRNTLTGEYVRELFSILLDQLAEEGIRDVGHSQEEITDILRRRLLVVVGTLTKEFLDGVIAEQGFSPEELEYLKALTRALQEHIDKKVANGQVGQSVPFAEGALPQQPILPQQQSFPGQTSGTTASGNLAHLVAGHNSNSRPPAMFNPQQHQPSPGQSSGHLPGNLAEAARPSSNSPTVDFSS